MRYGNSGGKVEIETTTWLFQSLCQEEEKEVMALAGYWIMILKNK